MLAISHIKVTQWILGINIHQYLVTLWAPNAEKQVDDEHANTQKCSFQRSKVII